MAVAAKCLEDRFSLIVDDEAEHIEEVGRFKYLGRLMDQSDEYCPSVMHNISKERHVRGHLWELLQREGGR